jgi:hypothetical protein
MKGFPVEAIARAIMACRPVKALTAKIRVYLAGIDAGRLRMIVCVLILGMLMGDLVLLLHVGGPSRASPPYTVIRPVVTAGAERRTSKVKPLGQAWDSLIRDASTKKQWDSLLRLRPGLRDTLRRLERMDSVVMER